MKRPLCKQCLRHVVLAIICCYSPVLACGSLGQAESTKRSDPCYLELTGAILVGSLLWAEILFRLEAFMNPQDAIPRESAMKQHRNVKQYSTTIRRVYASPLHCRTANPVLTRFVVKDIFLHAPHDIRRYLKEHDQQNT